MGKLIYVSSVMNSGKTARLLQMNFDYTRIGRKTILLKPICDTREATIKSRNGLEETCSLISSIDDLSQIKNFDIAFIDEAQFLSVDEVDALREISFKNNVDIYCFGLKTDFKGSLFPGSQRLLEMSDHIDELKAMCLCGQKATMNLKYDSSTGTVLKDGVSIECGYEDKYMSVCYKHWNATNISEINFSV